MSGCPESAALPVDLWHQSVTKVANAQTSARDTRTAKQIEQSLAHLKKLEDGGDKHTFNAPVLILSPTFCTSGLLNTR